MPLLNGRTLLVAGLSVVVTALVFGAVTLLLRDDGNAPIEVMLPTPPEEGSGSPASGNLSGGPTAAQGELKVYVSGAVHNPGVYVLRENDRLSDAVGAAGGAASDASLDMVNLARRVQDEGHYHIPRIGEPAPTSDSASLAGNQGNASKTGAGGGGLINLNLASEDLLDTLPGIGESLAKAIIKYREEQGPFESVEEITNVPRIGPAVYEKILHLVTVGE